MINRWSLGMDRWFMPHLTGHAISYLLGLKLIHIINRGPRSSKNLFSKSDFNMDFIVIQTFKFDIILRVCISTSHSAYHYSDVIMSTMASQITSRTNVYSTVYSGADQRKHQNSASLAVVWGIHRWPVNFPHKGPVTRKNVSFWGRHHMIYWLLGDIYQVMQFSHPVDGWESISGAISSYYALASLPMKWSLGTTDKETCPEYHRPTFRLRQLYRHSLVTGPATETILDIIYLKYNMKMESTNDFTRLLGHLWWHRIYEIAVFVFGIVSSFVWIICSSIL